LHEFENLQSTLSAFVLCYETLMPLQALRERMLRKACLFPRNFELIQEFLMFRSP
jgi:hypothetical protein